MKAIADDGASDHQTGTCRESLQCAKQPQRLDVPGDRAAERGHGVDREPREHDGPPAEGVRQRTLPQHHECIGEQISGQRLLNSKLRDVEFAADVVKGRQVSVNGERTEHRQGGEQCRQRPIATCRCVHLSPREASAFKAHTARLRRGAQPRWRSDRIEARTA